MVHHEDHKGKLVAIPQVDSWSSALYVYRPLFSDLPLWENIENSEPSPSNTYIHTERCVKFQGLPQKYMTLGQEASEPVLCFGSQVIFFFSHR